MRFVHRKKQGGLAALFFVISMTLPSCGDPDEKNKRVVLISIDTLRYDTLMGGEKPSSMPLTLAWAKKGLVFNEFYTSMATTLPSHVSMHTALHPWEHGVSKNGLILDEKFDTVAEILQEEGFSTGAVVASAPLLSQFGLSQGFEAYIDDFELNPDKKHRVAGAELSGDNFYSLAETITESALQIIASTREDQFLWFHYFDPHSPYGDTDPDRMRTMEEILGMVQPGPLEKRTEQAKRAALVANRLYKQDVAYLDRSLDRLLRNLLEDDRYKTHIILTSDHGENLGELMTIGHGVHLSREALHIPCVILGPDVAPQERNDVAGSIDIAPTLLTLAGVHDHELRGRDLIRENDQIGSAFGMRRIYVEPMKDIRLDRRAFEIPDRLFFTIQNRKIITGHSEKLLGKSALELEASDPETAKKVTMLFKLFEEDLKGTSASATMDPKLRKALKDLGYVE